MEHIKTFLLFILFMCILLASGYLAFQFLKTHEYPSDIDLSQYCAEDEEIQQCIAGPCCCKVGVICN